MKLFNSNSQIDIYDNDYIVEKLMEAEEQIKTKTINNIIAEDKSRIFEISCCVLD